MTENTTKELQHLIHRLKAGDDSARWELLERAYGRLRGLTSQILGDFPRLRDDGLWKTTEVAGEARVRLATALQDVQLSDTKHFFRLAAQRIRWLLFDLVRRLPRSERAALAVRFPVDLPPHTYDYQAVLAKLLVLLQELPEEQYAILDLEFAFGFNDREISAALDVDDSTVRRRRRRAYETIFKGLRDAFPGLGGGLATSQQ